MARDVTALLERAAGDAPPVSWEQIHRRSVAIRRRRHGRAAAALVLVVAVTTVVATEVRRGGDELRVVTALGETVLPLPPVGSTAPEFLPDGTPVFVVHPAEGDVHVVEAISTHTPYDLSKPVGWCASSGGFEDWVHGSKWDATGRRRDGPTPLGLTTYPTLGVEGSLVRVSLDRQEDELERQLPFMPRPTYTGGVCEEVAFEGALGTPGTNVAHDFGELAEVPDLAAAAEREGEWVRVERARVELRATGAELCDLAGCERIGSQPAGREAVWGWDTPVVVRGHGGEIDDVIVLRWEQRWRGAPGYER